MCVPYSEIRSTVLSRRPVNSASLSHRRGRESTFRGGEILGNAGGREPQHPWGGSRDVGLVAGVSCIISRVIRSAPTMS
jgi:hypothetical protein